MLVMPTVTITIKTSLASPIKTPYPDDSMMIISMNAEQNNMKQNKLNGS